VSSDMDINSQEVEQVKDSAKSPKKKKSKKVKSTKEDTSTKRNRKRLEPQEELLCNAACGSNLLREGLQI